MASADLKDELECSICLSIYTDPVTLRCGHNFCRGCIEGVQEIGDESGLCACPECREVFDKRPPLQRNITLCKIIDNYLTSRPDVVEYGYFCTYCVDSPVLAVKSCLLCEALLCEKHLKVHKKSPEHVLGKPNACLEDRKCPVHKDKILEYFCTVDSACICASCCLLGEHFGHKVFSLAESSKRKKKKLRKDLKKVRKEVEEVEDKIQSLRERQRNACDEVAAQFRDLRAQLDDLEKRVLSDMASQVQTYDGRIQQLELQKLELSRKMWDMEWLCKMTDPLTVLRGLPSGDNCDTEDRHDKRIPDEEDLDVAGISHTLQILSDIVSGVNVCFYRQKAAEILLDIDTASNDLYLLRDRKIVVRSNDRQNRPDLPERFEENSQVLSSQSFSSGRHYWDVDVRASDGWIVGVSYPSINRKDHSGALGCNNKSWGIVWQGDYWMSYDHENIKLDENLSIDRVRVYVDYEAGQISFYSLCNPIRHLYTYTNPFTEPLHAALCVWDGCVKISEGPPEV